MSVKIAKKILEYKDSLEKQTKQGKNTFLNSSYFTPSQMETLKNKLEKQKKLLLSFNSKVVSTTTREMIKLNKAKEPIGKEDEFIVTLKIYLEIIDIESGDVLNKEIATSGSGTDPSFATGGAFTYGKRYILMDLLGVAADENDPEHNSNYKAKADNASKPQYTGDEPATDRMKNYCMELIANNKIIAAEKGWDKLIADKITYKAAQVIIKTLKNAPIPSPDEIIYLQHRGVDKK